MMEWKGLWVIWYGLQIYGMLGPMVSMRKLSISCFWLPIRRSNVASKSGDESKENGEGRAC